jgi:superfamily I DNA/RNA helicase
MSWSEFQINIFAAVLSILRSGRDLVVLARAGTGKTSTMVEAVIRFCQEYSRARVLTCAFNVKNARELDSRLRDAGLDWKQASAKTLNSVGLATCKKAWGKGVEVEPQKGRRIARGLALDYESQNVAPIPGLKGKISKLATMAKITLTDPTNTPAMVNLCWDYAIAEEQDEVAPLCRLAKAAMDQSREDSMIVDFDDQLWFPHVFKLQPWKHDLVIVDEAQDMNPSQLELARKSVKSGGRLIAIGDDRQAIYGWRGADSNFMSRMVDELNAVTLPLPLTYRCAQNIVAEAQALVPDYRAHDSNPEGTVDTVSRGKMEAEAREGDFIISRLNAPLLPLCLGFLKDGIPALIQGRDVMGQLIALIERSECETTSDLILWIDGYESIERAKLVAADADEQVLEALKDRCDCIRALAPERTLCRDLCHYLDTLFTDKDDSRVITLSSAHRSKGLERDRVWLLQDTFRSGGQEDNCLYVAITRARSELYYVTK